MEEVHSAPIGPNALPFVGTAQPTPQVITQQFVTNIWQQ